MGSISSQTDVSEYLFLEWRGNILKAVREFLNYMSDPLELVYSGIAGKNTIRKFQLGILYVSELPKSIKK